VEFNAMVQIFVMFVSLNYHTFTYLVDRDMHDAVLSIPSCKAIPSRYKKNGEWQKSSVQLAVKDGSLSWIAFSFESVKEF